MKGPAVRGFPSKGRIPKIPEPSGERPPKDPEPRALRPNPASLPSPISYLVEALLEHFKPRIDAFMPEKIPNIYGLWGALALILVAQGFWSLFLAYPGALERMLRRGRSWVYVPMAWQGFRRWRTQLVSRILVLTGSALWAVLLAHHSGRHKAWWVAGFFLIGYAGLSWLQGFWNGFRYKQQEDAYYLLHDELRTKMVAENKDFTEAQLRSLSAYQHQQRLRKADEEGVFLKVLGEEAKRFRQARTAPNQPSPPSQAVEA
jgi:hypothetical protein